MLKEIVRDLKMPVPQLLSITPPFGVLACHLNRARMRRILLLTPLKAEPYLPCSPRRGSRCSLKQPGASREIEQQMVGGLSDTQRQELWDLLTACIEGIK